MVSILIQMLSVGLFEINEIGFVTFFLDLSSDLESVVILSI